MLKDASKRRLDVVMAWAIDLAWAVAVLGTTLPTHIDRLLVEVHINSAGL
jgi:hypothetical protein